MRMRLFSLAMALAFSSPSYAENAPRSPLIGAWEVDTATLPIPAEARPQRVTVTFSEAGDGRLGTRVEVIDAAGAVLYAESVAPLDGSVVPVEGNLEANSAAASMPEPTVLVMQLARANVPGSTRIYTVSPDGQSMTETAANYAADGRPMMRVNHFTRVR